MQAGDENKMTHQGLNVLMCHQFLVTNIDSNVFSIISKENCYFVFCNELV